MTPEGQKILELCKEKSSKPFGSKMRQYSLEIIHSCTSIRSVHIFQSSQYLYHFSQMYPYWCLAKKDNLQVSKLNIAVAYKYSL
jgi:hypothetical protein